VSGLTTFDPWLAAVSLLAGGVLGALFFGGLWWTLRRVAASRRPYGWLAASFAVRGAVVLAGFALLARLGGWWPPLAALLGFVAARLVLVRRFGPGPGAGAKQPVPDRLAGEG
jgi:F1F0 ATPase subunit 2